MSSNNKGGGGDGTFDPTKMGKIVDIKGKPVRGVSPVQAVMPDIERMLGSKPLLDLVARVHNLESVVIMLATTLKKGAVAHPDFEEHRFELDTYMECFYMAQVLRGATHLEKAAANEDGDVFL